MTYTGRMPPDRPYLNLGTGQVKIWREWVPPRRVPRFRADGTIGYGEGRVVGPWKPWRVKVQFMRGPDVPGEER